MKRISCINFHIDWASSSEPNNLRKQITNVSSNKLPVPFSCVIDSQTKTRSSVNISNSEWIIYSSVFIQQFIKKNEKKNLSYISFVWNIQSKVEVMWSRKIIWLVLVWIFSKTLVIHRYFRPFKLLRKKDASKISIFSILWAEVRGVARDANYLGSSLFGKYQILRFMDPPNIWVFESMY